MILLFIRGLLHVLLDLDSVGITEMVTDWLHGFDLTAVEAGSRLAMVTWEFAPQFGLWSVHRPLFPNRDGDVAGATARLANGWHWEVSATTRPESGQ